MFLKQFVPSRPPSVVLTAARRQSSIVFTAVYTLLMIVGRFYNLVDHRRPFYEPFVPRRRSSDFSTAVCAL